MNLEEIKKKANDEKERIIQHHMGTAMVIGGPGSRKTTILVEKILSLCNEANPARIVAITLTNNAADEMKKRVGEICSGSNKELPELRISTMHFLAKGLLHQYASKLNLHSSFRVVGKPQERILLDDVRFELKRQKINLGRYQNRYLSRFKASRAFVKNNSLDTIDEMQFKKGLASHEQFNECYRSLLDYYRSVDWYDVVAFAVKLLNENVDILEEVAGEIEHLLVDEYQDLNRADHELIRLLSKKAKSLIVFGDDDQSIYQTGRFANPGGIKQFKEIYPDAKLYPLSVCWRCGSSIIDASWKLVDVNEALLPERMPKEKPIPNPERGTGEFEIKSFKSEKAEIKTIISEVQNELKKVPPPKDILILFHSKEIGQKYVDAILTNGFKIENLLRISQTDSKSVLLLYEVLRLVNDETDNLAARFILQGFFGLNLRLIAKARTISRNQNKPLWKVVTESTNVDEKLKIWSEYFTKWRQMDNIVEMLKDVTKVLDINKEIEIQRIFTWCSQVEVFTLHKLINCIEKGIDFDEQTPVGTAEDGISRIITMTMHGAKGLDADVVFVPALEDELMPNQWCEPEQRRLLYVSMTRAKRRLFLSWAWSRIGEATYRSYNRAMTHRLRSRFLGDIEK